MSDTSDTSTVHTYSGDITLTGSMTPPLEVTGPDDVFVQLHAISGQLTVDNAETVFTHQASEQVTPTSNTETTVRGDLDDLYAQTAVVDGDVHITNAEDVFVPRDAVGGAFESRGAENVYSTTAVESPSDPSVYDEAVLGWRESATLSDLETGFFVTGAHHTIEVEQTTTDIDAYIVGYGHDVTIDGRAAAVNVCILGYENTVRVGPRLSVADHTKTGFDNEVIDEPYPVADLIDTSKEEAFETAGFGRNKITYQQPATEEAWCPNCGMAADAIVERHQMDAWFLFGYPIKVYGKSMNPAMECEHCSLHAVTTELSERERTSVL